MFSGHADKNDLIHFVSNQNKDILKQIFLVHGEEDSMNSFQASLNELGYSRVTIPEKGQRWEL